MLNPIEDTAPALALLSAAFAAAQPDASPLSPSANAFLAAITADYRPEELPRLGLDDLGWRAAEFWTFATRQAGPWPSIRLVAATARDGRRLGADLVEIVQPDAPFLVDSVMGELVDAGLGVLAMFHPLIDMPGGRRSAIQIWLDPVGDDRAPAVLDLIAATLADVRLAVEDFPAMLARMARAAAELRTTSPIGDPAALREDLDFLAWAGADHFVFLGSRTYEYPRAPDGGYAAEEPLILAEDSLGVLRDPARAVLRRTNEPAVLSAQMRESLAAAAPVVVAKSNLKSRVHRRGYMDYIGVRRYGPDGKPCGEVRFVGLFTSQAYDQPVRAVPLIRRKVDQVMTRAGLAPGSHNATRLANILETYPRDELFHIDEDELLRIALGVLHLSDRPRVKLFVRRDAFDRFVSVLFYAPRDRYDAALRRRVGALLAEAFGRGGIWSRTSPRWRRRSPRPRAVGATIWRPPCAAPSRPAARRKRSPLGPRPSRSAIATGTGRTRRWPTSPRPRGSAPAPRWRFGSIGRPMTPRAGSASRSTRRTRPSPWPTCCRSWTTWG
jgi:glutamate dehydrogenase